MHMNPPFEYLLANKAKMRDEMLQGSRRCEKTRFNFERKESDISKVFG